jgi:NAD(P)-dependent dehydrogenase (short-subunit alcohol dehydrogenase family)
VTGASSGIGRAVALRLLQTGAHVVAVSRDTARLSELHSSSGDLQCIGLDLLKAEEFQSAVSQMPPLDGIVHSAGIVAVRPAAFFSLEQHHQVMDTNLTAPLALTGELLKQRKISKGASIVFVSSINGNNLAVRGCSSYAASKAGLVGASRVLALELTPQSIRVNCVLPGAVDGPMGDSLTHISEETRAAELRSYPLGQRFAQPDEIAAAVLFLLSKEASFITGQTLTIDGGRSVQ